MLNKIKNILRPLRRIKPFYAFLLMARAKYEVNRAFSDKTSSPILIYQMGKVASTSIFNTIRCSNITNPVLQLHFLSNDLLKYKKNLKEVGVYPPPYHIYLGEAARKYVTKPSVKSTKIISLVRDPISFVISDLFHNPYFYNEIANDTNGLTDPKNVSEYLKNILSRPDTFNYINEWFDRELKMVFNVDVFSYQFPVDIGYAIYRKANIDLLIMRLENLSQNGGYALSEFLETDKPLDIKHDNVRNLTKDSVIYKQVLECIHLDRKLCEKIYSSKFVKHFYSNEMIDSFISKWSNVPNLTSVN